MVIHGPAIYWPSAHPVTVPGLRVRASLTLIVISRLISRVLLGDSFEASWRPLWGLWGLILGFLGARWGVFGLGVLGLS